MKDRIESYVVLLESYGARPTFPVTANVVSRHPDFFRDLRSRCELSVHGLVHEDYRTIPRSVRSVHLDLSKRIFREIGIESPGFRAPYLSTNQDLFEDIKGARFDYDASTSVFWPVVERTRTVELALKAYSPMTVREALPQMISRDVPILATSLPDDEILVDRLGIRNPARLSKLWIRAFELCLADGMPFVTDIHPERILLCEDALRALIVHATSVEPPVEILTMNELALKARRGETPRALCLTGDVDVLELLDGVRGPRL